MVPDAHLYKGLAASTQRHANKQTQCCVQGNGFVDSRTRIDRSLKLVNFLHSPAGSDEKCCTNELEKIGHPSACTSFYVGALSVESGFWFLKLPGGMKRARRSVKQMKPTHITGRDYGAGEHHVPRHLKKSR